jgi:glutathione S-transferase
MKLKLYEMTPSRSVRARWTLLELDMPFESVNGRQLFGSAELRKVHPLGKLPALEADGKPLFESAAIATWLADQKPEKGLAHEPGSRERALHDQWVSFALTEMEAYLWSRLRNSPDFPLEPPGGKVAAIIPQCDACFRQSVKVLDDALAGKSHLVGDRFSVTDIIVAFTANWGRRVGLTGGCPNINRWLDDLYNRPHCPLAKPEPASAAA